MASCDTSTLLSSASCFSCYPKGFFLPLKLVLLSRILAAKGAEVPSIATLLERGACFACLTPGQIQLIRLQLLCNIIGGNTLYSNEISAGPEFANGDPSLNWNFEGQGTEESKTYTLSITSVTDGTTLEWTYPSIIADEEDYTPVKLILQRSSNRYGMPRINPFIQGRVSHNFYSRAGSSESSAAPEHTMGCDAGVDGPGAGDVGWSDLFSWGPEDSMYDWPTTYTDSSVPNGTVYGYRLIALFIQGDPSFRVELDWNVVRAIGQYEFLVPATNPRTLTWTAPDTSCWD